MVTPAYQDNHCTFYQGDNLEVLAALPSESVRCCVTSPPYYGLRDYDLPPTTWPDGWVGCHGLEPTPEMYVEHEVVIFEGVRRVLQEDGTLWLNLGDSYAGSGKGPSTPGSKQNTNKGSMRNTRTYTFDGIKNKDLIGIPWMVAFALRAKGWYLRSSIIWNKPNPMTESVEDRPTSSYENIFLLSKKSTYYYDGDSIKEPIKDPVDHLRRLRAQTASNKSNPDAMRNGLRPRQVRPPQHNLGPQKPIYANKRNVWTVVTSGYPEAHFATFPPDLIKPCILAGSRSGDVVLDPFLGSGTTSWVAKELGRRAVGIELNPDYLAMARRRVKQEVLPLETTGA